MEQPHNTPRDDEHKDEEYVAFPGGIPKKWLGPAMTLLCGVAVVYVPWAVWQTIRVGIAAGTPGVHIARDVFQHLVFFAAGMSFLIVVCAKILERVIMYYLQAKKRIDDAERLTEAALQRAEQERQLRLQLEQQLQTERQRAEEAEQRVEQEHQLRLQLEQQVQTERQRAEAAEMGNLRLENKRLANAFAEAATGAVSTAFRRFTQLFRLQNGASSIPGEFAYPSCGFIELTRNMHKIVVCAKILERVIMYYLQAKKRIDDAERRAEQERQLRLQLEQQLQIERQRAETAEQRAEAAEQRAETAENGKPHA